MTDRPFSAGVVYFSAADAVASGGGHPSEKSAAMHRIGPRIVALLILAILTIPLFYFGASYVNDPDLCEGDVLEERECRHCDGTGKDEQLAYDMPGMGDRCVFCRGGGTVRVILPGPNRPSRVHGAIFDEAAQESFFDGGLGGDPLSPLGGPRTGGRLLMPLTGGIPGAAVTITPQYGGEPIALVTNQHGRFLAKVPPGSYTVTVTAGGFYEEERELEVPILTEPIWLEFANLIEPPESAAHEQSLYGLEVRVPMERR